MYGETNLHKAFHFYSHENTLAFLLKTRFFLPLFQWKTPVKSGIPIGIILARILIGYITV